MEFLSFQFGRNVPSALSEKLFVTHLLYSPARVSHTAVSWMLRAPCLLHYLQKDRQFKALLQGYF